MLKVSGNQIVTANGGCNVRLVGVNVDCLEWSANGQQTTNGITEGILQTVQEAATAWKANCVRIAIDQDWWDGNAQSTRGGTSQATYQGIVDSIVAYCNNANLYCDLDLQWSGNGPTGSATGQYSMPDQNSLTFWQSVAARYANNPSVLFDTFNEPYPNSWSVWLNGGTTNEGFTTPGFQAIVNKIRGTQSGGGPYASGTYAENICLVGGLGYSWDFQGMSPVSDPGGNGIVYAAHIYNNKGGCNCNTLWESNVDPALNYGPVLIEEFGNNENTTDNGAFVNSVISWMNGNNDKNYVYGGMAWELGTEATPLLVSDWNWNQTSYEGNQVYAWLHSITEPACGSPRPPSRRPPRPSFPTPGGSTRADQLIRTRTEMSGRPIPITREATRPTKEPPSRALPIPPSTTPSVMGRISVTFLTFPPGPFRSPWISPRPPRRMMAWGTGCSTSWPTG